MDRLDRLLILEHLAVSQYRVYQYSNNMLLVDNEAVECSNIVKNVSSTTVVAVVHSTTIHKFITYYCITYFAGLSMIIAK